MGVQQISNSEPTYFDRSYELSRSRDVPQVNIKKIMSHCPTLGRIDLLMQEDCQRRLNASNQAVQAETADLTTLQQEQRNLFDKETEVNRQQREKEREAARLNRYSTYFDVMTIAGSLAVGMVTGGIAGGIMAGIGVVNVVRYAMESSGLLLKVSESLTSTKKEAKELLPWLHSGIRTLVGGVTTAGVIFGGWGGLTEASKTLFQTAMGYGTLFSSTTRGLVQYRNTHVEAAANNYRGQSLEVRGQSNDHEFVVQEAYERLRTGYRTFGSSLDNYVEAMRGMQEINWKLQGEI